jgi:hypothetical protein
LAVPDWITQEYGHADFGDQRLTRRCCQVLAHFYRQPQASIPQACGDWKETLAAYRMLDNDKLTMDNLIAPHQQTILPQLQSHPVVLAVQDTTFLNFTTHPATKGVGPIGTQPDGSIGLLLHSTLAFAPDGQALGVLDAHCWARDPKQFGKKRLRHRRPLDEKESSKWLDSLRLTQKLFPQLFSTQIVHLSDRESDLFELFALARSCPNGPAVLVRARHNRRLVSQAGKKHPKRLYQFLHSQPLAGEISIRVPRRGERPERIAKLEIRFCEVSLKPPNGKAAQGPLSLWAVEACGVASHVFWDWHFTLFETQAYGSLHTDS